MTAQVETSPSRFLDWLRAVGPEIEKALHAVVAETTLAHAPADLREAVKAALLSGGKRVRPALALLACRAHGGETRAALAGGVACELIHAYSLVHDDLPCMDDAELRRGRPSVHVAFGEANAVLAGDALQCLAFEVLSGQSDAELARDQARLLSEASGPSGMVGGQVLDLDAEGGLPDLESVEAIHRAKTAALLGAALKLGARAAGGDPRAWSAYAGSIGRLFQATDDLLDATGSTAELGKQAGQDAASGKATLPAVLGLDGARSYAADLAEKASRALEALPVQHCREELADLPLFLLERGR